MSAAGFDIGNENCVIAVARQQGIDVLLNDESKRETPAVVSFGERQRFMGSSGAALASMQPNSTISQIKRLIGRQFKEPIVQDDLKLLPFKASEGPDGGILIHLQYLNEERTFSPIQILAMLLSHLKQITEKNIKTHVSDIVIGIPSYLTNFQRHAYVQAAEIAGLKTLRLMHDCTATALGYGIYKTDIPKRGSINVVFVDIGHSDTQVAVVSFMHGRMKVLSHASDKNLGGRDFDEVLFKYFASLFKEQDNIDVYPSARASRRLRGSCEKLKRVLSANPEAPLSIECLMEDKDVTGYITRDDFEKLSSELLDRIAIPCHQALIDSRLTTEKIHSVELVGSGSRVPAISKILKTVFNKEPRRTLNASECVAFGCGLQCAMLSPSFSVRNYEVLDCLPFSVGFKFDKRPISPSADQIVFPKGIPFPNSKMLGFHKSDAVRLKAFYSNLDELTSGMHPEISIFKIESSRVSHVEKARIEIQVQMDLHGLVAIQSATLVEDHFDDSYFNKFYGTISRHAEPGWHINPGRATVSAGDEMRRAKANRRKELSVQQYIIGGLILLDLSKAKEMEHELAQQDIKTERAKDKKNTLESYVYDTRTKLLNTYRNFAADSEKKTISQALQQTEEWLYEDGDVAAEHVYIERLEDLQKMIDPIEHRYKDVALRTLASQQLLENIGHHRIVVKNFHPNERDEFFRECDEAEKWLRERMQQQESQPENEDPVLWSSEISSKSDALACTLTWMYEDFMSRKVSHQKQEEDPPIEKDDAQGDPPIEKDDAQGESGDDHGVEMGETHYFMF